MPSSKPNGRPRVYLQALHDCATLCKRTPANPAGDMRLRAACRCALPDFPVSRWAREPLDEEAELLVTDLDHDLDAFGCPWSWVLSGQARALGAYIGTRTWDGQRARSLLLEREVMHGDQGTAELLWSAVQTYERLEDRAYVAAQRASETS